MPRKVNMGLVALAALAAAVLADPSVDRRASMGFMGMRGKKDDGVSDETSAAAAVELDKRTLVFRRPLFGGGRTVGGGGGGGGSAEGFKRAMGFVGMRGKKEYYKGSAAAAGFFGVRGKKVPSGDAFFGMRGKKWPDQQRQQQQQQRRQPSTVLIQRLPDGDTDVEQAVFDLHNIMENLRSERERNFLAAKFDEDREIR